MVYIHTGTQVYTDTHTCTELTFSNTSLLSLNPSLLQDCSGVLVVHLKPTLHINTWMDI